MRVQSKDPNVRKNYLIGRNARIKPNSIKAKALLSQKGGGGEKQGGEEGGEIKIR